jgi:hypothetical protein
MDKETIINIIKSFNKKDESRIIKDIEHYYDHILKDIDFDIFREKFNITTNDIIIGVNVRDDKKINVYYLELKTLQDKDNTSLYSKYVDYNFKNYKDYELVEIRKRKLEKLKKYD